MQTFSNEPINISQLPTWEQVEFRPISDRYKRVIYINTLIIWMLLVGAAAAAVFSSESESPLSYFLPIAGAITLFIVVYFVFNLISFRRRGYAVREHDVLYRAGIFYHYTLIIPFRHIQHVKINESVLSRIFSLATIELFTAGAGRDMRLAGIDKEAALILQQHISERISLIKKNRPNRESTTL